MKLAIINVSQVTAQIRAFFRSGAIIYFHALFGLIGPF